MKRNFILFKCGCNHHGGNKGKGLINCFEFIFPSQLLHQRDIYVSWLHFTRARVSLQQQHSLAWIKIYLTGVCLCEWRLLAYNPSSQWNELLHSSLNDKCFDRGLWWQMLSNQQFSTYNQQQNPQEQNTCTHTGVFHTGKTKIWSVRE